MKDKIRKLPKFPPKFEQIKKGVKANMSDSEIGRQLGISRQYVFQVRTKFNLKKSIIKLSTE